MKKGTLIFDFDGTIADSFGLIFKILEEEAGRFGFQPLSASEWPALRGVDSLGILRKLGIPVFKLPALAKTVKQRLNDQILELTPFAGMPELIKQLAESFDLAILSSNSEENIRLFLCQKELDSYFKRVLSGRTLFGKHHLIHNLYSDSKLTKPFMYIGDETRDIDSAHKAHIPVIAVSWGFADSATLMKSRPNYLVNSPAEIAAICASWP